MPKRSSVSRLPRPPAALGNPKASKQSRLRVTGGRPITRFILRLVEGPLVAGSHFSTTFKLEVTFKPQNRRFHMEEIAVYKVEEGQSRLRRVLLQRLIVAKSCGQYPGETRRPTHNKSHPAGWLLFTTTHTSTGQRSATAERLTSSTRSPPSNAPSHPPTPPTPEPTWPSANSRLPAPQASAAPACAPSSGRSSRW